MSQTQDLSITKDEGWVEVATGKSSGYFAGNSGYFTQYESLPPENHNGFRLESFGYRYELKSGESLYVKTDRRQSFFAIIPDA
tara:strand:- start:6658 stop:6906 length:249 start_codon:yes stop_codon:yes gene_type:complete